MKVDKGLTASLVIAGTSGVLGAVLSYGALTAFSLAGLWLNVARNLVKDNE